MRNAENIFGRYMVRVIGCRVFGEDAVSIQHYALVVCVVLCNTQNSSQLLGSEMEFADRSFQLRLAVQPALRDLCSLVGLINHHSKSVVTARSGEACSLS